jgi:DNA-binding CsgD family transcriptional regulator
MRLPFGAFASLIPATNYPGGSDETHSAMLRSVGKAIIGLGDGNNRLVIMIDDAHFLDEVSATLVHQLAVSRSAFIVMTVRSHEHAPSPVVALWTRGLVERIDLAGLEVEGVEALLSAGLGGQVDAAAANLLAERSRGNVLFLRELALGAMRDRSFVNESGIWRLAEPLRPSERLVELVETRLRELNEDERALLELVCWGEPLEMSELAEMADLSLAEHLERRSFLSARKEGGRLVARPVHPVYGDVVRARTPALRVPRLATLLADTVEAKGDLHPRDILRVAAWRLDGGGGRADLMLAAATTARWSYDFRLAGRLVDRALEAGAGFDAALLSAEVATLQGRIADGQERLRKLVEDTVDDRQRTLVALARMNNAAFYGGSIDEGLEIAMEAERTIQEVSFLDEIYARRSGLLLAKEGPGAAVDALLPVLESDNERALAWAYQIAAPSLARMGRFIEALDAAESGLRIATSLSRPTEWYPWIHTFFKCQALRLSGRVCEAVALARIEYDGAIESGSIEAQAWFAWGMSAATREQGDIAAATRYARESAALFRELGRPLTERESLVDLIICLCLSGCPSEARDALCSLDSLNMSPAFLTGVELIRARGWLAAAENDLYKARELFGEAIDTGMRIGDLVGAATALHDLARLGYATKELVRKLADVAQSVEGVLIRKQVEHAQALLDDDAAGLDLLADEFCELGWRVLGAEAALDAASAWRNAGQARQAAGSELRATAIAKQCAGMALLERGRVGLRVVLTRAEREAAMLAATGRSNRSIAEQLSLSVRTVEGRLQQVYDKLGINGRKELRAQLTSVLGESPDGSSE